MDHGEAVAVSRQRRWIRLPITVIAVVALAGTLVVAGCARAPSDMAGPATQAPVAVGGAAGAGVAPADATSAWNARPAFVNTTPRVQEAYAYALFNPQFVEWMPCYCGCAAMGHRSNLDCYLKQATLGRATQFEEHASYCDVCVEITLTTKQLISQGRSLLDVRHVIDQQFGGSVPGTPTELPPA